MHNYPIAYADEEIAGCACALVKQLEDRDQDPILILIGEGNEAAPTAFHRRRDIHPDGSWNWEAEDDRGRRVQSGILHEAPAHEMDEDHEEELALAGAD